MKKFTFLFLLLGAFSAFSQESDRIGNCSILTPNTADNNNRYCSGTSFGVTYKGYLASNKCYPSIFKAMKAMKDMDACKKESSFGNCSILNPNTLDNNTRYCSGSSFGVVYKGYLIHNQACIDTIDKAISVMEQTSACHQEDRRDDLAILYPNVADNNRHYCSGTTFGITYKGTMTESRCYNSIDDAISEMNGI